MDNKKPMEELIFLHLKGELTEAQEKELEEWRLKDPENEELFNELTHFETLMPKLAVFDEMEKSGSKEKAQNKVLESLKTRS